MASRKEIARRAAAALAAIKQSAVEVGSGVAIFVSHHLEELDAAYWRKHMATPSPSRDRVLDLLVLHSHWADEDEDGIEVFDFTLQDDATDYLISVRFDDRGEIEGISIES